MSELPNIDIIIPNYNKGNYLEECLNSVISHRAIKIGKYIW